MTKHSNASDSQQPERSSFFTKQFKEDIKYWKKHCQAKYNRIQELIQETKEKPFDGKGNPKPLVHINYEGHKASARRIDEEHRLVYVVTADKIFFSKLATITRKIR